MIYSGFDLFMYVNNPNKPIHYNESDHSTYERGDFYNEPVHSEKVHEWIGGLSRLFLKWKAASSVGHIRLYTS